MIRIKMKKFFMNLILEKKIYGVAIKDIFSFKYRNIFNTQEKAVLYDKSILGNEIFGCLYYLSCSIINTTMNYSYLIFNIYIGYAYIVKARSKCRIHRYQ